MKQREEKEMEVGNTSCLEFNSNFVAQATEIYSLIVPEARSPKSKYWQDWFLLKVLRENLFHASLLYSGSCQQPVLFLGFKTPHYRAFSPVGLFVSKFLSPYKDTSHCIRTRPNLVWLYLKLIMSTKTLFPVKATFTGPGVLYLSRAFWWT